MSIALKFTSLFIRTLAKPIATQIKTAAREHPNFRKRCISAAQALHRAEARLRVLLLIESEKKIAPLNDARAIQAGANFVAESFVFSVAGSLILYESWRSRRKEAKRQATVADDIRILQDEIIWIKQKLQQNYIIKEGDEITLPPGLKPAVLKILDEHNIPVDFTKKDAATKVVEAIEPPTKIEASNEAKASQEAKASK